MEKKYRFSKFLVEKLQGLTYIDAGRQFYHELRTAITNFRFDPVLLF
jgi:hypothetical protein